MKKVHQAIQFIYKSSGRRTLLRVLMLWAVVSIFSSPEIAIQAHAQGTLITEPAPTPEMPLWMVPVFLVAAGGMAFHLRRRMLFA